ncbi:hypothetical protein HYH03_012617 [Edaphochlamys debaryana]|uniref:Uncharacterized protein n=1 Tax=Edaphochlamys debaryana TaxID=47281 RepID=A0A836BV95_9CHLO|nr:hypothetical protein HYH03_012617 [Edaphochlamys debaryana]|eukprot:KAG2488818.1 hypothetical protein HYH03_012617 [Edaphochlamys debaryana]
MWQLHSYGRSEEKRCRFCNQALPALWKPDSSAQKEELRVAPVMAVRYNGPEGTREFKLRVRPGPEGLALFKAHLKAVLGFDVGPEFLVTFECQMPATGSTVTLSGLNAYGAATHCAALLAATKSGSPSSAPASSGAAAGTAAASDDTSAAGAASGAAASGAGAASSSTDSVSRGSGSGGPQAGTSTSAEHNSQQQRLSPPAQPQPPMRPPRQLVPLASPPAATATTSVGAASASAATAAPASAAAVAGPSAGEAPPERTSSSFRRTCQRGYMGLDGRRSIGDQPGPIWARPGPAGTAVPWRRHTSYDARTVPVGPGARSAGYGTDPEVDEEESLFRQLLAAAAARRAAAEAGRQGSSTTAAWRRRSAPALSAAATTAAAVRPPIASAARQPAAAAEPQPQPAARPGSRVLSFLSEMRCSSGAVTTGATAPTSPLASAAAAAAPQLQRNGSSARRFVPPPPPPLAARASTSISSGSDAASGATNTISTAASVGFLSSGSSTRTEMSPSPASADRAPALALPPAGPARGQVEPAAVSSAPTAAREEAPASQRLPAVVRGSRKKTVGSWLRKLLPGGSA